MSIIVVADVVVAVAVDIVVEVVVDVVVVFAAIQQHKTFI